MEVTYLLAFWSAYSFNIECFMWQVVELANLSKTVSIELNTPSLQQFVSQNQWKKNRTRVHYLKENVFDSFKDEFGHDRASKMQGCVDERLPSATELEGISISIEDGLAIANKKVDEGFVEFVKGHDTKIKDFLRTYVSEQSKGDKEFCSLPVWQKEYERALIGAENSIEILGVSNWRMLSMDEMKEKSDLFPEAEGPELRFQEGPITVMLQIESPTGRNHEVAISVGCQHGN